MDAGGIVTDHTLCSFRKGKASNIFTGPTFSILKQTPCVLTVAPAEEESVALLGMVGTQGGLDRRWQGEN